MKDSKLKTIIPWGDSEIQRYLYCPKDEAHYVILNDGSWQFVDDGMVKMYGQNYGLKDTSVIFNYTMIVQNPEKSCKLEKEEGFYELYLARNLLGWDEVNIHYYDHSVVPWDQNDRIYVELLGANLDPETCRKKYKELIHSLLSEPFKYNSDHVARYYLNLRTGEAYVLLSGGAWQFLELNDDTGVHFISEYGINYFYDEEESVMDMDIFCSRESEFDQWKFVESGDDDDGFALYEFQDFFGKGETYVSYNSRKKDCSLDSMFFDIKDFEISPEQARAFFGYDLYNRGEFAISKEALNSKNEEGEFYKNKFGLAKVSVLFALVVLMVAGFYYLTLKIIPDVFDKDQMIFFSGIWGLILLCFIFPFLAAKNQYIEISRKSLLYSNMFGKKTEYEYKEILGIAHGKSNGKTGSYIMIFPKEKKSRLITLYEKQYKKFQQIDEILTNNLDEISFNDYFEYCSMSD
ncbi:hypothetical protein [Treponema sp.]|uniref:hypothetical protein n=1 Tax=Treponema sp. TaxID=166 RepID=UPI00298EACC1|nr:hypothetical protein [Treponema sp.]MCQ2241134.1 hypothetical protein [Treponema sp.]